jgi:HlyD family secretion protein
MKRQIQLWGTRVFSIALVILAVNYWGLPMYKQYFAPKKISVFVPTGPAREGGFIVSFHEIGTLQAEKSVPVNTDTGGKIISLVADGVVVKQGDPLITMDTTDLERDVRSKQLTYGNTKANLDKANEEFNILKETNTVDLAKAEAQQDFDKNELEMAKRDLDKQTRLAKDKLVPQSDVEKADLQLRSKTLTVLKGEKDLALKKDDIRSKEEQKKADVRNVEFQVTMAKIDLEDAQNRVKKGIIKAPSGGLVVISKSWTPDGFRKVKEGDSVRPRQTLCELPDLTKMLVKVQVGEADAPKVSVGIPTTIRLEAVPNKVFHGTIADISSLATEPDPMESNATPGRKNFEVTIDLKEVDPKVLKPGMTADVEFVCETLKDAVYVPLEAVTERENKTFIFVKKAGKFVRVPVTTGKSNDNYVCIQKGLKKGQTIALRDPTRPMDEQEAGTGSEASKEKKKDEKTAPPIPGG